MVFSVLSFCLNKLYVLLEILVSYRSLLVNYIENEQCLSIIQWAKNVNINYPQGMILKLRSKWIYVWVTPFWHLGSKLNVYHSLHVNTEIMMGQVKKQNQWKKCLYLRLAIVLSNLLCFECQQEILRYWFMSPNLFSFFPLSLSFFSFIFLLVCVLIFLIQSFSFSLDYPETQSVD